MSLPALLRHALLRHALIVGLLLFAAASRAAPTLVGTSTQASSSATNLVTLTAPAGLAAGDLMLAILVARTGNLPLDQQLSGVPSGWTLVRSEDDGDSMGLAIYRKFATAAEPASYGWTLGSSARVAAALQAFRGVDPATPVEASGSQANSSSSTYAAPSVTTSTANALVVSFHAANNGNGSVANPSGMTQAIDLPTGAGPNGAVVGSSNVVQAVAGASGNKLSTGNASLTSLGALVALRSGPAATGPDHYELSVPTTSLTCLPTTVTVRACTTSASTCSVATAVNGSVVLSATAGTLGASLLTFANGIATTTLSLASGADNTAAALSLGAESSPATHADRCCPNGSNCVAASSCATTFNRAGFIVATDPSSASNAGSAAVTLPVQTAGTASGDYYLRAVRTNSSTQACEAAVTGARNVSWAYRCNDPATCSGSNLMTVNAGTPTVIQRNNASATATYTAVPMSFDAYGNAGFNFTFADVGQVTFLTSLSLSVGSAGTDTLTGSSSAFITKPAGFTVTNVADAASPFAANPGATDYTGMAFVAAGAAFKARITAVTSSGAATPNFGKESSPEGVLLTPTLVEPAGGTTGSIANAGVGGAQFSSGIADVANLGYSEVGIMKLTPALASGSYLGAGNGSVTGTPTGPIGRFIPAGFTVVAQSPTQRSAMALTCPASTFTYLDEDFQLAFRLTAVNTANVQTQNYSGNYARLNLADPTKFKLAGISGATIFKTTDRLSVSLSAGSWANGVADPVTLTARVARAASPDGPFGAASFGIAPLDTDGVGLMAPDLDTDPTAAGNDRALVGQIPLRYGRLRLQNGMSAAGRVLRLPLTAQYWDSTAATFKTNDLDSCTRVTSTNLSFGNLRKTLTTADVVMNPTTVTVNGAQPSFITLAKPANGGLGSVDVAIALGQTAADNSCLKTSAGWTPVVAATAGAGLAGLRGVWCGSAASSDPSARAIWGLYRGADGVIYQRENY